MKRVKLTENNISDIVREAADKLQKGRAIIFPTDTLYGLGADALREDAVERFFALKKRPANKPIPLFVKDIDMAKELAFIDKKQEEILSKFWPGAFTFVLNKRKKVSSRLSANTQKIGLRIPNNDFCRALLNEFNSPITASSANISGMENPADVDEIINQFKAESVTPSFVIEADKQAGEPSLVVDISFPQKPQVIRMSQTNPQKMQEIFDIMK